jgi:hypothetical protein
LQAHRESTSRARCRRRALDLDAGTHNFTVPAFVVRRDVTFVTTDKRKVGLLRDRLESARTMKERLRRRTSIVVVPNVPVLLDVDGRKLERQVRDFQPKLIS